VVPQLACYAGRALKRKDLFGSPHWMHLELLRHKFRCARTDISALFTGKCSRQWRDRPGWVPSHETTRTTRPTAGPGASASVLAPILDSTDYVILLFDKRRLWTGTPLHDRLSESRFCLSNRAPVSWVDAPASRAPPVPNSYVLDLLPPLRLISECPRLCVSAQNSESFL
jgi:hypothetical protein